MPHPPNPRRMPQQPRPPNAAYNAPNFQYFGMPPYAWHNPITTSCFPGVQNPTLRSGGLYFGLTFIPLLPMGFCHQTLPTTVLPQRGMQVPQPNVAAPTQRTEGPPSGPGPMRSRRNNRSENRPVPHARPARASPTRASPSTNLPTLEEIEREEEELRRRFYILKGTIPPENAS
jgi:hypothetical protein